MSESIYQTFKEDKKDTFIENSISWKPRLIF